jgi:hypothetical protein
MQPLFSTPLGRGPWILAGASAAAGLAMLLWLAASMPGRDMLTIGAIMLAAFGYHTYRAVRTLNDELRELDAPAEA